MGRRGAGRRLNDQERMEILEIVQREAKVKNVDLAKQYGVSEGAIRKLRQMKDTVRNRYYMGNEQNRDKRKRGGFKRNAPFEQELYQWIVRMRESQPYQLVPLTQTAVRQQAIVLSKNYEKMANFKASPGWFARFCSRHRLDPVVVEDAGVAAPAPADADAAVLAAGGVPQSVAVPPAVSLPMAAGGTDETAFLMDTLTAAPVTTSQAMEMVKAMEDESKTETPSINEQAQLAAREHNEAALRAAVAKIGEAQAAVAAAEAEAKAADTSETDADIKTETETPTAEEEEDEGKKKHEEASASADAAVAVGEDEIFSLGL